MDNDRDTDNAAYELGTDCGHLGDVVEPPQAPTMPPRQRNVVVTAPMLGAFAVIAVTLSVAGLAAFAYALGIGMLEAMLLAALAVYAVAISAGFAVLIVAALFGLRG